jgi:hypothetical protein
MHALIRTVAGALLALVAVEARTQSAAPPPQSSHSLVYDEQLQQVVLIGGIGATPMTDAADIWTWNGRQWARAHFSGLPSRYLSAAAYDSARKRLVVFGGRVGPIGFTKGDTWEWDGAAWREASDASVGIRDHHSLAYDERRRRTVLYGGAVPPADLPPRQQTTRRYPDDTWEWDGARWRRLPVDGPGQRNGSSLSYDARRGNTVLFGGIGEDRAYRSGTWTWDGETWRQAATDGPPPRATHRTVYDHRAGVVLLYGGGFTDGTNALQRQDMWQWDGRQWTEVRMEGPTPGPRIAHAMAYDRSRERVVLFGGFGKDSALLGDTWEWDGTRWLKMAG